MMDVLHIDEKWFYLTEVKKNYYLGNDDHDPYRSVRNKRFISKVMFLIAVAWPIWETRYNRQFDGKIGTWPFIVMGNAQKNSRNIPSVTIISNPINSINKEVCNRFMVDKVLPEIAENFRATTVEFLSKYSKVMRPPHVKPQDPQFVAAAQATGIKISLIYQPHNSPELNFLDPGFLSSIYSLQHTKAPQNVEDLTTAVTDSYNKQHFSKIKNIFLT